MRRRPFAVPASAVAVAVVVLVAGCGGGSSPGVANVGSSTSSSSSGSSGPPTAAQIRQEQLDATRFARCMRSHGALNFPDPNVAPRAFKDALSNQSSEVRSAYPSCGHLLPGGNSHNQSPTRTRTQVEALLAFAHCLRGHGFPSFPDPSSAGELSRETLAHAGIDIHASVLVRAADACTTVTHGVITRAVVARFVAGH